MSHLKRNHRHPQAKIRAEYVDIHLGSIRDCHQLVLVPAKNCVAHSRCKATALAGTNQYGHPRGKLRLELASAVIADRLLGLGRADDADQAKQNRNRRRSIDEAKREAPFLRAKHLDGMA